MTFKEGFKVYSAAKVFQQEGTGIVTVSSEKQ